METKKVKLEIGLTVAIAVIIIVIAIIASAFLKSSYFAGNITYPVMERTIPTIDTPVPTLKLDTDFPEATSTPESLYEEPPEGREGTLELD